MNRKLQRRRIEMQSCSIASFMSGCSFQFFRRHSTFEPDAFSFGSGISGTGLFKNFASGSQPSGNIQFLWVEKTNLWRSKRAVDGAELFSPLLNYAHDNFESSLPCSRRNIFHTRLESKNRSLVWSSEAVLATNALEIKYRLAAKI